MSDVSTIILQAHKNELRNSAHVQVDRLLNITPAQVVATAQINQTVFTYPTAQLTVNNTTGWSNIKPRMMYWIGDAPGKFNIAVGVVRKTPTSDTLYIDPKSKGDPGSPMGTRNIFRAFSDDYHITIIKFYPVWGELSRISSGIFYKNYDRPYLGELYDLPPVANVGTWQAAFVNPITNKAQFQLSATKSFAYSGKSIIAYSWDVDSATIVDGTATDASITIECDAGFFAPSCTVTDSGGQQHTARTYLWSNALSGSNAPYSTRYGVQLGGIRSDAQGGDMTFTVAGENAADIFPFAGVLYQEAPLYDNAPDPSERVSDRFVGYIEGFDVERTRTLRTSTYKVLSPIKRAQSIASVTQQLDETPVPANWAQISESNPLHALDYLLRYHAPALLENHDFIASGNFTRLRRKSFVFQSEGLGAQMTFVESVAQANIGSLSDGTTLFCLDPLRMKPSDQNALPLLWDWQRSDYAAPERLSVDMSPRTGYVLAYAFSYDGYNIEAWGAAAPGKSQGQSNNKPTLPSLVVPAYDAEYNAAAFGGLPYPQYRLMELVGVEYAIQNREITGINLTVNRNLDIADPADLRYWHVFANDEWLTPNGSYLRMIPTRVNRTWKQINGIAVKQISVEFEFEAFGQPGIPVEIERGGASAFVNPEGWTTDLPAVYEPEFPEYEMDAEEEGYFAWMAAWNSLGMFARTFNALDKDVVWEKIDGYKGRMVDACLFVYATVNYAGLATWEAETKTARVYYAGNIDRDDNSLGSPFVERVITSEQFDGRLRLRVSTSNGFHAGLLWKTSAGIEILRTTSLIWTGAALTQLTGGSNVSAGLHDIDYLLDGNQYFVAGQSAGVYRLYHATGLGSFTEVLANPADNDTSRRPPSVTKRYNNVDTVITLVDMISVTPEALVIDSFTENPPILTHLVDDSQDDAALYPATAVVYGYNRMFVMPDALLGKLTSVSEILVTGVFNTSYPFDYGTPPNFYPPLPQYNSITKSIPLKITLLCRNLRGDIVYQETQTLNTLDDPVSIWYLPSPSQLDHVRVSKGFTFNPTFAPEKNIAYVEMRVVAQEPLPGYSRNSEGNGGYFERYLAPAAHISFRHVFNTQLEVTKTSTIVDGLRLYRLSNYDDTTPTWSDITQNDGYMPLAVYSLAVDPDGTNRLAMIGTNAEGETRLFLSENGGTSWTKKDRVSYKGIKRFGDTLVLFGNNALDISDNLYRTRYSRLGNWSKAIGAVGTIEGVLLNE